MLEVAGVVYRRFLWVGVVAAGLGGPVAAQTAVRTPVAGAHEASFDVAVIQLLLDPSGLGDGTMAAAARVKPGEAGVDVEAYEGDPVKLLSIMRKVT